MNRAPTAALPATVAIIADDLIWVSRLRAAVERAGGHPTVVRPNAVAATRADLLIVDLTGRGYDGVAVVAAAAAAGSTVICVGQHEDLELRKRALAAGARRVYSYNKMFKDGPAVIVGWLARDPEGEAD